MHFFRPMARRVRKDRQGRKALRVRRVQLANKVPLVLREASERKVSSDRLAQQADKDLQAPQVRRAQPAHRAQLDPRVRKERA